MNKDKSGNVIDMNLDEQGFDIAVKNMRRDERLDSFDQLLLLLKALRRNNGINGLSPYSTLDIVPAYKKGHFVFIPED
mgnify:CR=1 FL=1